MTEAEWNNCADPWSMLQYVEGHPSLRKLRLFACACCRRMEALRERQHCGDAIRISEGYADGIASEAELDEVIQELWQATRAAPNDAVITATLHATFFVSPNVYCPTELDADVSAESAAIAIVSTQSKGNKGEERRIQAGILRDILGNPFRSVLFNPTLMPTRGEAGNKLTETIYTERAFDLLPILADALQEAGCTDAAILEHCRGPGPHVRGCWVVDLLLGKS